MSFIVGIDGPAGSGKGTVTKRVANILGLTNMDTGITYRCVALEVLNRNIDMKDVDKIIEVANEIKIEIQSGKDKDIVFLNGKDVTEEIRGKEVTGIVSPISSIKEVRYKMVEIQRELASRKRCHSRRKRHLYFCISKCRCENILRCKFRRKSTKKI